MTASSRVHSLTTTPATHQRSTINSQSLASHHTQLNQQQRTKTATATLVRSSPSPAPSINSACLSNSLFSSSNISNNNNLSKSSFKNTTTNTTTTTNDTDNSNRLKSSNFKNAIVGGNDDDDSDDIIIIDAHDTESTSTARTTTNGVAAINNFDENANFSSATSPLTRSQDDDSSSTRQLPMNRARLKSNADKDDLNFSNFDDSKHASSSDSFRRFFTSKTVLDGGMVTEPSATLSIDEQRSQAEQSVADTTSTIACVDDASRRAAIDLPAITNKLNGLRCSNDIKVSSSDPVAKETRIDVDVDMERAGGSVTLSEQPRIKIIKCVPPSALFDRVDVAKVMQPELTALEVHRPTLALAETSRTQTQTNSSTIEESEALIIDDSMSRCSLDDFGGTSETASKDVPVMGAQRVFNAVPTYDDSTPVLKYRSASPYFEQEHQKEQQKSSTSKQSVCDSQEINALRTTTKTQSTEAVSSSTSTTMDKAAENKRRSIILSRRSFHDWSKRSDSTEQVPTISSNENFLSATLVDSGIASPVDEAVSKDFNKVDQNFADGLFCDTKPLAKNVSYKTAFTTKRLNGFRVERSAQPKTNEVPAVDAVSEKCAAMPTPPIQNDDILSTTHEKPVEAKESTSPAVAENKLPSNESEMEIDANEEPTLSACAETIRRDMTGESTLTINASEVIRISIESKDEVEVEAIHDEIDSEMQSESDDIVDETISEEQPTSNTAIEKLSEKSCDMDVVPASPQQEPPSAIVEEEIDSQQAADGEMVVVPIVVEKVDQIEVASISLESQMPETNFDQRSELEAESQEKTDEVVEVTIFTEDPISETPDENGAMETALVDVSTEDSTRETLVEKEATESASEQEIDVVEEVITSTEDRIPKTLIDKEITESSSEQGIDESEEVTTSTEDPIPRTLVDKRATESSSEQEIDEVEKVTTSSEDSIPETIVDKEANNSAPEQETDEVVEAIVDEKVESALEQEINDQIPETVVDEKAIESALQQETDEVLEVTVSTDDRIPEALIDEKATESELQQEIDGFVEVTTSTEDPVPRTLVDKEATESALDHEIDEIEVILISTESQMPEATVEHVVEQEDERNRTEEREEMSKEMICDEAEKQRSTDEIVEAAISMEVQMADPEEKTSESEIVQMVHETEPSDVPSEFQMSEANAVPDSKQEIAEETISQRKIDGTVEATISTEDQLSGTVIVEGATESEEVQKIDKVEIIPVPSTSQLSEANVKQILEQEDEPEIDEGMSEKSVQQEVEQEAEHKDELEIDEDMPETNVQQEAGQEDGQGNAFQIDEDMPEANVLQIVEQEDEQVREKERVEEIREEVEPQREIDETVDDSIPTESQTLETVIVVEKATESEVEQKIDELEDAVVSAESQIPEANVEPLIGQEEMQKHERLIDQEIPETIVEQIVEPQSDQEILEKSDSREKADEIADVSICDEDQMPFKAIVRESDESEMHEQNNKVVETTISEPHQALECTIESTEKIVTVDLQSELREKVAEENIESHLEIVVTEVPSVSRQQETPETYEETTPQIDGVEEEVISAQTQWSKKVIVEKKIEADIQSNTIVIAAPSVEHSPIHTFAPDEQEAEIDLIDEITCDEIPNGPIEIEECTQEMPSPADEAFTAPLLADLEEINATAEKIRVEFESTKSVAHLDATVEIDEDVMLDSEIAIVPESTTPSQNAEEVPQKVIAEESAQSIDHKQQTDLMPEVVIAVDAVSTAAEEKITEAVVVSVPEIVTEELLVTCSTSEIEPKPYDGEDIILMDIVCHPQTVESAKSNAERRSSSASDETISSSMPSDDRSEKKIIPEDVISPQETIYDETIKITETAFEPEMESEKANQASEEQQAFVTPIIESMERMEISSDELPTPSETECGKEISSIESNVPASVDEEISPSVAHQMEENVRTTETPEPIHISPIRNNESINSQPAMLVEPVAIFAARHFEIQEHAIDFSLKVAEPIEIIPIDAELHTETIVENESLQITESAEAAQNISPDSQLILAEKPIVEAAVIPETNSSLQTSIHSLQTIPFVNIVPVECDAKPKVEKKSGKSGRRTKPTKMVKVNHLNENTLREMCEKTSDNPMIDNLNVLVEVALADQIKNMPGVSVTVKSIQEIEEVANIPTPSVIISPSTMLSTAHTKTHSIKSPEPIVEIVPVPPPIVEHSAPAIQKKDEPTKKRWEKAENGVRKSARIKTKEKKNELFEDTFDDVDRALLKMRKMTEKRKAIIFRAVDTIKEISPYKEQPQQPVVVEERKAKSTETYVQKPVREKSIKSFKRPNSKTNDAKKPKPTPIIEKKKSPALVEKASAMLPPPPPPPRPSTPTLEEKSGPEILTALNLTAKKNPSKRTSSDVDVVTLPLPIDETQPIEETQQQSKKIKSFVDEIESNGIEVSVEPVTPTRLDEVLCSTDNSSSPCAKTIFSTPTKDIKNRLTNGHSGSGAAAVAGDSSPCAKRTIENDENKYMSPLVMKKTFECKCNSDRDRILKRLKEFDKVFQPISSDDDAIGLITETIPNDYMETRTTLIRIKKIFYQRFVNVMQQKSLGIPLYLTQMQQQLAAFSQNVSIDNKIFDDVVEWYGNMKDEMRTKNTHTVESVDLFSNFDRFLKWWGRKFKCYCTPIQNKKCSRKFYDTEESISSDSNSQDRNYSPAKASPTNKLARNIDEMTASASPELFVAFTAPTELDETQNAICETPSEVAPVQEPIAVVPESIIEVPLPSETTKSPEIEAASEPSLPIDAANTIISFPNLFVSDSTDIEITTADTAKQSIDSNGIDRTSPMYESEDSLLMLPSFDLSMSCDTMNFPDQLAQLDLQLENTFDAKSLSMSMYMDQATTIPMLSDVKNDALASSTPQKLNEIMLQNEIDNYSDDNIFGDFKREYVHRTDPTMGPSKKGYAERPLPVEEAVSSLIDNDLTRIPSLNNGHTECAPLADILNPYRIPKKASAEYVAYEDHTQTNQLGNCNGNENGFDSSDSAYIQDLSDYYDDNIFYYDALISNTSQNNNIENITNDMSVEASIDQTISECGKEQVLDEDTLPITNAENQQHESPNHTQHIEQIVTMSEEQTVEHMGYEQTELSLEEMIVYDPEDSASERCDEIIEDMEFSKSDYELNKVVPDTPAVEAQPMPPPKKSTNDDFHFKQPTLYPNGPSTKTHSSKHSSKSHKSKRKHHSDDSEAPSRKQYKFDDLKETTSSSSSHRDTSSSSSSISGCGSSISSQHHHKKSTHHALNYYVTRIKCVDSQSRSPSQSLSRSSIIENGDEKLPRGSHHHNGSNRISNKDLKLKIKKLTTDEPTKSNESPNVTSSNRRDSKKYHHSVSTSKLYEEAQSRKSHHSSSRKSSGSSRSLHKSNHWQVQVLK